jgi:membrane protein
MPAVGRGDDCTSHAYFGEVFFPRLRGVSPKLILRRLYRAIADDALTDTAAQLSYYFLFALFPFLFFLATLTAYLPVHGAVDALIERLQYVMPVEALTVVQGHLEALLHNPRPKLLTVGLAVTVWTASRSVDALRKGLNLAYDVPESRPFWWTQLLAIGMTIAGAVLILLAFAGFVLGGKVGEMLAARAGISEQFAIVWSWLRWPFTAMVVMFAAALSYYALPDVRQKFRYITPGSLTATVLWLATTWGFTRYVELFGTFDATYGSIGGVVVLLLWLYLTGLVFLLGGEVNAVIEHHSEEGKVRGARAEGEAPLPIEERPSAAPAGVAKQRKIHERLRERLRWRRRRPRHVPPPAGEKEPPPDSLH